ncbi:hypothetical protein L596_014590 [Steinernema carpocapsae]|uniref:Angiomotin C-terminal domain-containing protein n=1 Tax=Steinernema carpocapsae TaxID=34508 RepID=A0A4U5NCK1_STECR|nr:hypothetical protein L596_014590 [Steinernema carpocapsae]
MDGGAEKAAERGTPGVAEIGRSWSIEPSSMGQTGLLKNLLQEASSTNHLEAEDVDLNPEEIQLQNMIDNYVRHQQQQQMQQRPNGVGAAFAAISDDRNYHRPSAYSAPPMSHSQPCLFTPDQQKVVEVPVGSHMVHPPPPHPNAAINPPPMSASISRPHSSSDAPAPPEYREENVGAGRVAGTNTQRIIHALREENTKLKQQVDVLGKRAAKLQQLETAYERIEKEYEEVIGQRQKQENLEAAAMVEIEEQLARAVNENLLLRQRIAILSHQQTANPQYDHVDQVAKLNMFINDLMLQNKEVRERDERQRIEIEAQRVTLDEQRTHIDILEKAVRNAQDRINKKDQQAVDAAAVVDRANHLQKLVNELTEEKDRREEEIKRERAQFEMELTQLKMKAKDSLALGLKKSGGEESLTRLKKIIHQKDEKITTLERTVMELEKKLREAIRNNQSEHDSSLHELTEKVQRLEVEKSEKERVITELIEEKSRTLEREDQRRALDARIRMMEQEAAVARSTSSFDAAIRMEELRQKIADRRAWTSGMRMRPRAGIIAATHARTTSNGVSTLAIDPDAMGDHQRAFSGPSILRPNGGAAIPSNLNDDYVYRMHLGDDPKEEIYVPAVPHSSVPIGDVRTAAEYVADRNPAFLANRFQPQQQQTTGGSCSSNTSSIHSKSSSEADDDSPRFHTSVVKAKHPATWDV